MHVVQYKYLNYHQSSKRSDVWTVAKGNPEGPKIRLRITKEEWAEAQE
jgi:hypothetical protein